MLQPGHVLNDKYRVIRVLGRGGMASVYQVESIKLGHTWAVKEMAPSEDGQDVGHMAAQFQIEARLLANLDHSGLPQVVDFFDEEGKYYLVMEFIAGRDLQQVLEEHGGPLAEPIVVEWMQDLLDVLAYLHSRTPPIIFRDLKPSNVMLSDSGRIKLIDFGIAKTFNPTVRTGTAIRGAGTPGFAPLEQYGSGGTDHRTDIYGLGATLYYMLTTVIPPDSLMRFTRQADLLSLRQLAPTVSERLADVVHRCMEVQPSMRPQSVDEIRAAMGIGGVLPAVGIPAPVVVAAATPIPTVPAPVLPTVPASPARPTLPTFTVNPQDGSELVLVDEGEFWMGSPDGEGRDDERPQHAVRLPAFYLGRYPVTLGQFFTFAQATGWESAGDWRRFYDSRTANLPVVNVSLYDAYAYCAWAGLRLLTEAEWEKAARSADGRRYPWGDRWDPDRCNNWKMQRGTAMGQIREIVGGRGLVPVAAFPDGASPFGAIDMAGNVWEWTQSVFQAYPYQPADGRDTPPPPLESITVDWTYAIRGGAWNLHDREDFRCATRYWACPASHGPTCGFRVAK